MIAEEPRVSLTGLVAVAVGVEGKDLKSSDVNVRRSVKFDFSPEFLLEDLIKGRFAVDG